MSKIDNIYKGEPNLLDGSPPCPGQKQEGRKTDDELWEEIVQTHMFAYKKDPISKYLTFSEYQEYKSHRIYKWDDTRTRIQKNDRYDELIEKINHDEVIEYYEQERQRVRTFRLGEKKPNRYELGAREFTFTYSPKWFDDSEARLQMSSAIQKLCKYYKDEIIQMRAIGEVGSAGLSHIHCFYRLKGGKKITDKNFTRAYKMWNANKKTGPTGHQGGHHQTVKNESDFTGYIDKDIENAWFEVNIDNSLNPQ